MQTPREDRKESDASDCKTIEVKDSKPETQKTEEDYHPIGHEIHSRASEPIGRDSGY